MSGKPRLLALLALLLALVALASAATSRAQYGTSGTSEVIVNQTLVTLSPGGSAKVSFEVKLVSGTTWGTNVEVSTSSSYVTATASPSSGDPTFSGTLTIKVSASAPPGNYTVTIKATGDDPSNNTVTITVQVMSSTTTTTTTTQTTTTTTTSATTTTTTTSTTTPVATTSTAVEPVATVTVTSTSTYTTTTTMTTTVPLPSSSVSLAPLGAFVAVVVVSVVIIAVSLLMIPRRSAQVAAILTIVPSAYLLAYDAALRATAPLHYYLLMAYAVVELVLGAYTLARGLRPALWALSAVSGLMFIAMILDAVLGLPLSSVYTPGGLFGVKYLFGLGITPYSSLGISLAFTSLMILSAGAFGLSAGQLRLRAR